MSANSGAHLVIGIVQGELALLQQHQGGDRGDRLGHGGDAEQSVSRSIGRFRARFALAAKGELDDLALAPNQGDAAGEVAGVDRAPHNIRGAPERIHIEAADRDRAVIHVHVSLRRLACPLGGG